MLSDLVQELNPTVVDLRRRLHRIPEAGHEEYLTTEAIVEILRDHGLEPRLRENATGLWVDVGDDPKVGFRSDIDALPIDEPAGNDPRSEHPGWMHACGHDVHAAVAVGIALAWARLEAPAGGIRVVFQPAEERMPGGAGVLVSEGVLDGLESIIAFHVNPTLEPGTIGIRSGPVTASADGFRIVLEGPGGHTSRPERTVDLVSVAADLVLALPGEIRRAVDPSIPVVTAFGSVHGGDAPNVIPTTVTLRGTVRTGDRALWGGMGELVDRAVARHVSGIGATYQLKYTQGVAPVMNDPGVVATVARGITKYLGEEAVVPVEMSMGGEDFFEYLDHVPGALLRLGTGSGSGDIHSATFVADDRAIPIGVTAGVAALIELRGGPDS